MLKIIVIGFAFRICFMPLAYSINMCLHWAVMFGPVLYGLSCVLLKEDE